MVRLLSATIRILTLSRLVHVMVCYDGACLNPRYAGNQIGPSEPVILNYPGLVRAFVVPVEHSIDLDLYHLGVPKPILPTVIRWLTKGRFPVTCDCVAIALDCLRQGGVDPPRGITTPKHLHDWLQGRGYAAENLE